LLDEILIFLTLSSKGGADWIVISAFPTAAADALPVNLDTSV